VPAPYWPSYPEIVKLAGATPVILPTSADKGFLIEPEALSRAITPRTRMVRPDPILVDLGGSKLGSDRSRRATAGDPVQPVQPHWRRAPPGAPGRLGGGAGAAACQPRVGPLRRDLRADPLRHAPQVSSNSAFGSSNSLSTAARAEWILSFPRRCMAAVRGLRDRTLLINGFSKAYAMTGYRLGYLAAPLPIIKGCTKLQSQITSCASSIAQQAGKFSVSSHGLCHLLDGTVLHAAGIVALGLPDEALAPSVAGMRRKRDLVMRALGEIPGVRCQTPQGAFYVLPDVSAYYGRRTPKGDVLKDGHELCMYLLKEHRLALVPGDSFGAPETIRISYATSERELNEAMARLRTCLTSLQSH
jgi:aspartate/methionine/tyrosine aminotransferase